jgi:hypothetical protein
MDIEEFKSFILQMSELPSKAVLTIEPYIAIEKIGDIWFSYGFCYLYSSFLDSTFIGGYKGKSEIEMNIKKEQNTFIDLLHMHLEEVFSSARFKEFEIEYDFKPVTQFEWKNWDII